MAELLDYGNSRNIQGESGTVFKGSDSPLAQNNLVVTLCQKVVGGGKPLSNSAGKPPLQNNRTLPPANIGQQGLLKPLEYGYLAPFENILALEARREAEDRKLGFGLDVSPYHSRFADQPLERDDNRQQQETA